MLSGPSALLFFKLAISFPTSGMVRNGNSNLSFFVLILQNSFKVVGHWYFVLDSMFLSVSMV